MHPGDRPRPSAVSADPSATDAPRSADPAPPAAAEPDRQTPPAPPAESSSEPSSDAPDARHTFAADELAIVLSHYDLGAIESIHEFQRGSRRAPKLIIRAASGDYLLKRRARGKDDPYKVAFCHGIQLHLAERQFPLPHLIGTRDTNNSMLRCLGRVYELFEYIAGTGFDESPAAAEEAGKTLTLFHKLLRDFQPDYDPPSGAYHAAKTVYSSLRQVPETLARPAAADATEAPDAPDGAETARLTSAIARAYRDAADRVEQIGIGQWPRQIIHSDWHPGNMLFRGKRVVAVIDYDAARLEPRVIDVANGALQFSILGGAGDAPSRWPEHPDEDRFAAFLKGYDSVPDCILSRAELRSIPWLMIEALIAEGVIPIAATGRFAKLGGLGFLQMVERKAAWIRQNETRLVEMIDG